MVYEYTRGLTFGANRYGSGRYALASDRGQVFKSWGVHFKFILRRAKKPHPKP